MCIYCGNNYLLFKCTLQPLNYLMGLSKKIKAHLCVESTHYGKVNIESLMCVLKSNKRSGCTPAKNDTNIEKRTTIKFSSISIFNKSLLSSYEKIKLFFNV